MTVKKPVTSIEMKKDCIKIETEHNTVLPHYLIPSLGSIFPYWLKLSAKNSCNESIVLKIVFSSGKNVVSIEQGDKTQSLTIPANQSISKNYYPKLTLATSEPREIGLNFQVSIPEESGKIIPLNPNLIVTNILEPYTIDWTLKQPNGKSVDPKYLFASLSAWVIKPSPTVKEKVESCLESSAEGEKEIAICYQQLFKSNQPYFISSRGVVFPKSDEQVVEPLAKVIQRRGKISALEAGLLLAATMQLDKSGVSPKPSMVFVPIDANNPSKGKAIYVVWNDLDKRTWRGVNMQDIKNMSFDENVKNSSAALKNILNYANLRKQLDTKGVFIDNDKSVIMIKFRKAYRKHGIQPIPKGDIKNDL
jgi:hypothetical protein